MLERIEEENLWDILPASPDPIVLYGMGDGAEKILRLLQQHGRDADAVFASDEFVRGHSFLGKKVLRYQEVCEKYNHFTVLLAFGFHDEKMLNRIRTIQAAHPVLAPDIPVAGTGLFTREFIKTHEAEFNFVYQNLADSRSRQVFLAILHYKISGKVEYLYNSFDEKNTVYHEILRLNQIESIVDLGAYDGDTIREMLDATGGMYRHITAVEADEKNYKKLLKNTTGMTHIQCLQMGVWKERTMLPFSKKAGRNSRIGQGETMVQADAVDHLLTEPPTLLKMDVEGAEMQVLEGAVHTIRTHRPKLYVCAYHRNEDLFALPIKIWDICPEYKLYFRHSPYIPAWECNFYGIAPPAAKENEPDWKGQRTNEDY